MTGVGDRIERERERTEVRGTRGHRHDRIEALGERQGDRHAKRSYHSLPPNNHTKKEKGHPRALFFINISDPY